MTDRADPLIEVVNRQLWVSGCNAPLDGVILAGIDCLVAVGDGLQPWYDKWDGYWLAQVRPHERPQRSFLLHAPLIDTHRPGLFDRINAGLAADSAVRLIRAGRRVLVHCDGGMFRGPFIAALALARLHNIPGPDALGLVQRARGRRLDDPRIGVPSFDDMINKEGT